VNENESIIYNLILSEEGGKTVEELSTATGLSFVSVTEIIYSLFNKVDGLRGLYGAGGVRRIFKGGLAS
jgi:PIN domain nuclease of toxin-antitoxin system